MTSVEADISVLFHTSLSTFFITLSLNQTRHEKIFLKFFSRITYVTALFIKCSHHFVNQSKIPRENILTEEFLHCHDKLVFFSNGCQTQAVERFIRKNYFGLQCGPVYLFFFEFSATSSLNRVLAHSLTFLTSHSNKKKKHITYLTRIVAVRCKFDVISILAGTYP